MKILHVVHQFLPDHIGGTELYTHWVAQRQLQQGHQVSIFYRRYAASSGLTDRNDDGVQVWAAWSGKMTPRDRFMATFNEANIYNAFRQVIGRVRPDLVHIQHLMGIPVAILDHIQQLGLPVIITLHDYWWICANAQLITNYDHQLCEGPRAYLNCARCALARNGNRYLLPALPAVAGLLGWRNHNLRQVMNSVQTLIAPTEFVSRWYQARGVSASKLLVIPHGLDAPSIFPSVSTRNQPLRFALIVGGLTWQKGVHILLEAFQALSDVVAELWIAGDESADPTYTARLRALASPQVSFLGKLSRQAIWETLAQVDVIIVPSLWYETFSFIVSEAFAAGVPVIASRLGPLADRVRHDIDGLLVEPGDSRALYQTLLRFLEDPNLLPRLQAGIRPVYTLDEHVSRLESVYDAAMAHPHL